MPKKTKKDEILNEQAEETSGEIENLKNELESKSELLMRTAAEYENYKKRTAKEREALSEYIRAATLKPLLPAVDNIARAIATPSETAEYIKGVEMTLASLMDCFTRIGLTEINPENEVFDPNFCEAVMHIEDEDYGENTVAEVLQKGYKLGETVLRPAMVKVAN